MDKVEKLSEQINQPEEHILQYFEYEHLRADLKLVSRPFCELARAIVKGDQGDVVAFGSGLPRNPERTVALRKLLEAKDAAVRAMLAK